MLAAAWESQAQLRSERLASIVVPVSPGSLLDIVTRRFAEALRDVGMQAHQVENAPGGSGIVAANQVLRRPADGNTLLIGTSGMICNVPLLAKGRVSFDPRQDLMPVFALGRTPFVLFAGAGFPAGNLRELQDLARSRRAELLYAGSEIGSANHVAGEVLLGMLGTRGTHVPYLQNPQAYHDVIEGRVDFGIYGWNNIAPLVKAGRARVLALLANQPLRADPSIQTVESQGYGKFEIQGWYGLFTRRGVPEELLRAYEKTLDRIVEARSFVDFLHDAGQVPLMLKGNDFSSFIDSETERYRQVFLKLKLI